MWRYDYNQRDIEDTRRGALNYRYDPLGRLLTAQTITGEETFAFDPASNLLDPQASSQPIHYPAPKLLDNLLRDYVGTHYRYDERGNLKERLHNGKKSHFTWDLYDRLIGYGDDRLTATFAYDALGRRLFKLSKAKYHDRREAGPMWNKLERAKLDEQYGCGYTIYGWDGDVLAFESRHGERCERLTHYFFEPGSFVPVAQAVEQRSIQLLAEPVYEGAYDIDRDPVWQHRPKPVTFSAFAWYQCDHLGTPMELTDEQGGIAWSGVYKAWGFAKEERSETAKRTDIRNPLRFQGQYFDVETGLHYNRYRYYDPQVGRFVGKDPIGFAGGLNIYAYAPNPADWTDPLGLTRSGRKPAPTGKPNIDNRSCCAKKWSIERYDRKCNGHIPGVGNVALFRDPKDGSWYSVDKTEHGGSSWKLFSESRSAGTLEWMADLNDQGDIMKGKHKGSTGRSIDLKKLKCQDKK